MSDLDYYKDLSSEDPKIRTIAASKLIENAQLTIPKNLEKIEDEDPEYVLKHILGENGFYILKRLIKGLPSSRDHSRLGFSIALSEFLFEFKSIDLENIIKLIEKYINIQGNHSSREERELLFGRLFGLKAIILSKILQRTESIKKIENIIDALITLSLKKGWLREPCFILMNDILVQFQNLPKFQEIVNIILKKMYDANVLKTPEGVAIILAIQKFFKSLKPFGNIQWDPPSPLSFSNLETLTTVLKDININSKVKQRGNWNIKLHFVWNIIIEIYTSEISNIIDLPFSDFWTKVIDESLFSAASSLEKKFRGFQIFNLTLPQIEISNISFMFSKNFMRCFINHLSNEDRYLNKISNKVLSCIISVANIRKKAILPMIRSLLGPLGALNFDKITKTKLIESLIISADEDGLWDILQLLKTMTCSPYLNDIKNIDQKRQISIDIMLNILRNKKCKKNNKWIKEYINFFLIYGYFEPKSKKFEHSFSTNTRIVLRSRLLSSLAYLNVQNELNTRLCKNLQEQIFWPTIVIKSIISLSKSEKYNLLIDMDSETLEIKNKSIKIFKKILKKKLSSEEKDVQELFAFELLYSLSILQLYNCDPEASSVLQELGICYNNFFKKKNESECLENTIEILTDILLGFLSKNSILLRKLVEQVLKTDENSKGENMLFQEITSDKEYDDINNNCKLLNYKDKDVTEGFNNEVNDIGINNKLENDKKDALSVSNNIENDSEKSMDDERMFELDKKIVNIFKQRKEEKKKNKNVNSKENIIDFKSKVLDMLNIFLKVRGQEPIILNLIIPLLVLMRTTSSSVISKKVRDLIGNRICKAKINTNEIEIETVLNILKQIHKDALKIKKPVTGIAHSQCSIFLVKIITSKDISLLNQILKIYFTSFNNWLTKKQIKLQPTLFIDLVNWGNQFRQENKKR
ncbi:hypothetical protein PCANB_000571 [Pneumocystis canis]|nr:hypothetical protein PCANB_000571 [Pneumocystis canis]